MMCSYLQEAQVCLFMGHVTFNISVLLRPFRPSGRSKRSDLIKDQAAAVAAGQRRPVPSRPVLEQPPLPARHKRRWHFLICVTFVPKYFDCDSDSGAFGAFDA